MGQKTDRLYPSALFENKNFDLQQRLEKILNDVNSFNNHINKIKEMITYFKEKNNESEKRYKNYKTLTTKKNHSIHLLLLQQHRFLLPWVLLEYDSYTH